MSAGESSKNRNVRVFGTEQPVAFITGSQSPRVGRVIADYLAAESFHTVLHGSRTCKQTASGLDDQLVLTGRVEEEEQIERWLAEIRSRFGRVDLLVNSAAIWEPKSLESTTADDFENFFRVNSLGTALTCKHFGLQMCQQASGGAIVNIGDWAIARPYRDFSAYFPSKGTIPAITQSMAVELAERNSNVRVNAVMPGPVLLAEGISEERRQQIVSECLLRREGTPEDVAQAVLFLATCPFVTGVCLPVDGGRTIYAGRSADSSAHPDYDSA